MNSEVRVEVSHSTQFEVTEHLYLVISEPTLKNVFFGHFYMSKIDMTSFDLRGHGG